MTTENSRADALTDGQLCAIQYAMYSLRAIAERRELTGDVIRPLNDIRTASRRAAAALKRFEPVANALLAASPVEQPAAAPIDAISKLLSEAMDRAVSNGADSRSMPDEYVAIAHFTCYPEQYGYAKPAPSPENDLDAMTDAFERSEFYFRGETPAARVIAWRIWTAAWKAHAANEP